MSIITLSDDSDENEEKKIVLNQSQILNQSQNIDINEFLCSYQLNNQKLQFLRKKRYKFLNDDKIEFIEQENNINNYNNDEIIIINENSIDLNTNFNINNNNNEQKNDKNFINKNNDNNNNYQTNELNSNENINNKMNIDEINNNTFIKNKENEIDDDSINNNNNDNNNDSEDSYPTELEGEFEIDLNLYPTLSEIDYYGFNEIN